MRTWSMNSTNYAEVKNASENPYSFGTHLIESASDTSNESASHPWIADAVKRFLLVVVALYVGIILLLAFIPNLPLF